MPLVFPGPPGRVVAVDESGVQGFIPSLAGLKPNPLSFTGQRSVITRITVSQEANYQFLHTIGGDIYVYVFGDRIGQLTISGLSFSGSCDNGADRQHGLEKVMEWYKDNKISRRPNDDPKVKDTNPDNLVTCMIGLTPVTGFVVGLTGDVVDPKMMLAQFQLQMMIVPEQIPESKAAPTETLAIIGERA